MELMKISEELRKLNAVFLQVGGVFPGEAGDSVHDLLAKVSFEAGDCENLLKEIQGRNFTKRIVAPKDLFATPQHFRSCVQRRLCRFDCCTSTRRYEY